MYMYRSSWVLIRPTDTSMKYRVTDITCWYGLIHFLKFQSRQWHVSEICEYIYIYILSDGLALITKYSGNFLVLANYPSRIICDKWYPGNMFLSFSACCNVNPRLTHTHFLIDSGVQSQTCELIRYSNAAHQNSPGGESKWGLHGFFIMFHRPKSPWNPWRSVHIRPGGCLPEIPGRSLPTRPHWAFPKSWRTAIRL